MIPRGVLRLVPALLLAAPGCRVGPDPAPPEAALSESFAAAGEDRAGEPVALDRWWVHFGDPLLDSLVERALAVDRPPDGNLDLKAALTRVHAARARVGVVEADLGVQTTVVGGYARTRTSDNALSTPSAAIARRERSLFEVGFDSTWEIDVFGGIGRSVEAADADYRAEIAGFHAVEASIAAEVVRNYVELRASDRQLAITRGNLATQEDTLALTRARFTAGVASELDVVRAEALVAGTRGRLPALETFRRASLHRIGVLLGREPGALSAELAGAGPIPTLPAPPAVGVPAELLRRRPDILRAEQVLAASTARIGVAVADLYPRFTLTGSYGWQADHVEELDSRKSNFWSIVPGVSWPLLDAGRIRANIAVQEQFADEALLGYAQTILIALEESENAITAYDRERVRRANLEEAVTANRRAVDLARMLYERGLTDFLDVLTAERALLDSEAALVDSEADIATQLVALFKALGGGWLPPETQASTLPPP